MPHSNAFVKAIMNISHPIIELTEEHTGTVTLDDNNRSIITHSIIPKLQSGPRHCSAVSPLTNTSVYLPWDTSFEEQALDQLNKVTSVSWDLLPLSYADNSGCLAPAHCHKSPITLVNCVCVCVCVCVPPVHTCYNSIKIRLASHHCTESCF